MDCPDRGYSLTCQYYWISVSSELISLFSNIVVSQLNLKFFYRNVINLIFVLIQAMDAMEDLFRVLIRDPRIEPAAMAFCPNIVKQGIYRNIES